MENLSAASGLEDTGTNSGQEFKGILVETDILAAYLLEGSDSESVLRRYLRRAPCFTSFVQAAELFACVDSAEERILVEKALYSLRILGAHARYAESIASLYQQGFDTVPGFSMRDAIVLGIAVESNLPVLTKKHVRKYRNFSSVTTIEPNDVRPGKGSTQKTVVDP